jgi:Zn-dependent protease
MENFSVRGLILAGEMLAALFVGMTLREYARAWTAAKLGDPTPRLWGRVTMKPSGWFEPFGSGLVPGLIAILWLVRYIVSPIAYAKPAPVDPTYLRHQPRDTILASLAGPLTSLAVAIGAGVAARALPVLTATGTVNEATFALTVLSYVSASLFVFHLLPIPGLDGARMVALVLPLNVRDTYRNFDRYLPFVVLLVLFFLGGLTVTFIDGLAGAICSSTAGFDCGKLFLIP